MYIYIIIYIYAVYIDFNDIISTSTRVHCPGDQHMQCKRPGASSAGGATHCKTRQGVVDSSIITTKNGDAYVYINLPTRIRYYWQHHWNMMRGYVKIC